LYTFFHAAAVSPVTLLITFNGEPDCANRFFEFRSTARAAPRSGEPKPDPRSSAENRECVPARLGGLSREGTTRAKGTRLAPPSVTARSGFARD